MWVCGGICHIGDTHYWIYWRLRRSRAERLLNNELQQSSWLPTKAFTAKIVASHVRYPLSCLKSLIWIKQALHTTPWGTPYNSHLASDRTELLAVVKVWLEPIQNHTSNAKPGTQAFNECCWLVQENNSSSFTPSKSKVDFILIDSNAISVKWPCL